MQNSKSDGNGAPVVPTLSVADLVAFLDDASASTIKRDVVLERGTSTSLTNTDPLRMAVGFAVILRRAGMAVPVGSVVAFAEALGAVGVDKRSSVYWAGRGVLIRRPEDIDLFNRVFAAFWLGVARVAPPEERIEQVSVAFDDPDNDLSDAAGEDDVQDDGGETVAVRFSAVETLRDKDFASYTAAEFDEARRLMAALKLAGSVRPCRRRKPIKRSAHSNHPDLRRTVRAALKTDGIPMNRRFLENSDKPRRIIFLCDVSGSMESYSRALLRFCQAAVVGRGRVEAFAVGTRLTRLTKDLTSRDPDTALRKAADRVVDWSGGTRLGEGMRTFNDRWGVRGMARGSIVVILSDGWDRGDPELLAEQMARLHRIAYRVVWVNPLKAAPGYAPLARGMAAALPHIDVFLEGHSFGSLEVLAEALT
jgi:uncharacterized protein